jgi:hypothetical protein
MALIRFFNKWSKITANVQHQENIPAKPERLFINLQGTKKLSSLSLDTTIC